MSEAVETLKQMVKESNRIVFFGGAGVSTESGIPDFRSVDGLYNQSYDYPPETILSHSFYMQKPEEFYRFYRDKMLCLDVEPNVTHKVLARLEEAGKLTSVVTQNIDGLHQAAGSKRVWELHGSVHRNYCQHCGKAFDARYILESPDPVPVCDTCGGRVKPDVVLYEEGLDEYTMQQAMDEVKMVVEGVYSAKAAIALAKKYGVDMPIIEEVNKVLFEDKPAKEAVNDLMLRDKKMEHGNLGWED